MPLVRVLVALLALVAVLCFVAYAVTRQPVWLRRGVLILKVAVGAAVLFFALMIMDRLSLLL